MPSTKEVVNGSIKKRVLLDEFSIYSPIDFLKVATQAHKLADKIEEDLDKVIDLLLTYESFEVVQDEVRRTLDLLRNLNENQRYFHTRTGGVTSFLPRNQPLYAFSCFVIIPSLMAESVHFRIPQSMRHFFPKLFQLLEIKSWFPNIYISSQSRAEFIKDRSALIKNPKTHEDQPVTSVVIFTGIPAHAEQLRTLFDKRTLFITNGAGHNPVVVSADANLDRAVEAVVTLQFYNQGQDCAAPNAILVHNDIYQLFIEKLRSYISELKVGSYNDRSCRIGPISDAKDLTRVQDFLIANREWLDISTPGIIRTHDAIVEPSIICKPLKLGGNFTEIFAPVVFVQSYDTDTSLAQYFEDHKYPRHAMYVTIYGTSPYIDLLPRRTIAGRKIHDEKSIIRNNHLHAPGIERGTRPYGGYGYGASSLSINGKIIAKPTLPQRDIYEWTIKPLSKDNIDKLRKKISDFTRIEKKDVEKLLRIEIHETQPIITNPDVEGGKKYLDTHVFEIKNTTRYIEVGEKALHTLLKQPNHAYRATLTSEAINHLRALKKMLNRKTKMQFSLFLKLLYAIPIEDNMSREKKVAKQRLFFEHIYQLLLGQSHGPHIAPFLWDVDTKETIQLLDV